MRIVFVTHQYPPQYTTGTELYAKRLALKLRGTAGHDVRVFTFEPSYRADAALVRREETVDDGVPVTRVYMWRGLLPNFVLGDSYNVFLGKMFGTYLSQVQPDAVHVFHSAFLGASILEEAKLRQIPTVVNLMDFWFLCPTAQLLKTRTQERCAGPDAFQCLECLSHGDLDYDRLLTFTRGDRFVPISEELAPPGDGLRWNSATPHAQLTALGARKELLRKTLLGVDRIIAPSLALKRTFERFGYPTESIQVSRYGVDPMPPYTFDKARSPELRVGFIGSINRPKGLHVVVDAVLNTPGPLTLDVYGNPGLFPDYAEACFARARKDPRIRLRGPTRPRTRADRAARSRRAGGAVAVAGEHAVRRARSLRGRRPGDRVERRRHLRDRPRRPQRPTVRAGRRVALGCDPARVGPRSRSTAPHVREVRRRADLARERA